jgi:hypothetical protein
MRVFKRAYVKAVGRDFSPGHAEQVALLAVDARRVKNKKLEPPVFDVRAAAINQRVSQEKGVEPEPMAKVIGGLVGRTVPARLPEQTRTTKSELVALLKDAPGLAEKKAVAQRYLADLRATVNRGEFEQANFGLNDLWGALILTDLDKTNSLGIDAERRELHLRVGAELAYHAIGVALERAEPKIAWEELYASFNDASELLQKYPRSEGKTRAEQLLSELEAREPELRRFADQSTTLRTILSAGMYDRAAKVAEDWSRTSPAWTDPKSGVLRKDALYAELATLYLKRASAPGALVEITDFKGLKLFMKTVPERLDGRERIRLFVGTNEADIATRRGGNHLIDPGPVWLESSVEMKLLGDSRAHRLGHGAP